MAGAGKAMKEQEMMANTHEATLVAENVTYDIGGKQLLCCVNLRARPGQLVGVIGPNGAGKSTLLRALAGVIRLAEGTILLEGSDLRTIPSAERSRTIALIPQIAPLAHGFSSLELVLMGRYPHMGRFQIEGASDERIALDAMRLTDTEHFADRTLETLSGGERQRIFIARALAQQPRVLLLDEPTANLDILHQLRVLNLIRESLNGGLTAIAAIHDLSMAARYCDRLALLSDGRVVAEGAPEEVLTPERIEAAYGVRAAVYHDPITGALAVSPIAPATGLSFDATERTAAAAAP